MSSKTYTIGSITAEGRTKTAARQAAEAAAAEAVSGDYTPSIVHWKGATAIVWREPTDHWLYRIIWPEDEQPEDGRPKPIYASCYSANNESRKDVEAAALQSMIQSTWTPADGVNPPDCYPDCYPMPRQSFTSWAEWQTFAQEGIDRHGLNYDDVHSYANARQSLAHYGTMSLDARGRHVEALAIEDHNAAAAAAA